MSDIFIPESEHNDHAIRILPLTSDQWSNFSESLSTSVHQWVQQSGFSAKTKQVCLVPSEQGGVDYILFGLGLSFDWMAITGLPYQLQPGQYQLDLALHDITSHEEYLTYLFWGLGSYSFDRYQDAPSEHATVVVPTHIDYTSLTTWTNSVFLGRDLVNTPCADLGPADLEQAIRQVADECDATLRITSGDVLAQEYPALYAVGKGAQQGPRLVDLTWGNKDAPKITLVGKGVCFDTGGLNLKSPRGMRQMKKDMGGSAAAIALARVIMLQQWPVRLRLMIPAVENAIDNTSYRPGDVLQTRSGISVEVDNTDAEGRLIMCDVLFEACTESPEYLIDFATLTGARGVALGPDYAAIFSNQSDLAVDVQKHSVLQHDLVWPLPLHRPYNSMLSSTIADCQNCSTIGQAGTITAALFLDKFVGRETSWLHLDIPGEHEQALRGSKSGGNIEGVRAIASFLREKLAL